MDRVTAGQGGGTVAPAALTPQEIARVVPRIAGRMMLMRPVRSEPPLCTLAALRTVLNLDDVFDLHEALNIREAAHAKFERSRR